MSVAADFEAEFVDLQKDNVAKLVLSFNRERLVFLEKANAVVPVLVTFEELRELEHVLKVALGRQRNPRPFLYQPVVLPRLLVTEPGLLGDHLAGYQADYLEGGVLRLFREVQVNPVARKALELYRFFSLSDCDAVVALRSFEGF